MSPQSNYKDLNTAFAQNGKTQYPFTKKDILACVEHYRNRRRLGLSDGDATTTLGPCTDQDFQESLQFLIYEFDMDIRKVNLDALETLLVNGMKVAFGSNDNNYKRNGQLKKLYKDLETTYFLFDVNKYISMFTDDMISIFYDVLCYIFVYQVHWNCFWVETDTMYLALSKCKQINSYRFPPPPLSEQGNDERTAEQKEKFEMLKRIMKWLVVHRYFLVLDDDNNGKQYIAIGPKAEVEPFFSDLCEEAKQQNPQFKALHLTCPAAPPPNNNNNKRKSRSVEVEEGEEGMEVQRNNNDDDNGDDDGNNDDDDDDDDDDDFHPRKKRKQKKTKRSGNEACNLPFNHRVNTKLDGIFESLGDGAISIEQASKLLHDEIKQNNSATHSKSFSVKDCEHLRKELSNNTYSRQLQLSLMEKGVFAIEPIGSHVQTEYLNFHRTVPLYRFTKTSDLVNLMNDDNTHRHAQEEEHTDEMNKLNAINLGGNKPGRIGMGMGVNIPLHHLRRLTNFIRWFLPRILGYNEPLKSAIDLGHASGAVPLFLASVGGFDEAYGIELSTDQYQLSLNSWEQHQAYRENHKQQLHVVLQYGDIFDVDSFSPIDLVIMNLKGLPYNVDGVRDRCDYFRLNQVVNRSSGTKVFAIGIPGDYTLGKTYFPQFVDDLDWKYHVPVFTVNATNGMPFVIFVNKICFESDGVRPDPAIIRHGTAAIVSSNDSPCPLKDAMELMKKVKQGQFSEVCQMLKTNIEKKQAKKRERKKDDKYTPSM